MAYFPRFDTQEERMYAAGDLLAKNCFAALAVLIKHRYLQHRSTAINGRLGTAEARRRQGLLRRRLLLPGYSAAPGGAAEP